MNSAWVKIFFMYPSLLSQIFFLALALKMCVVHMWIAQINMKLKLCNILLITMQRTAALWEDPRQKWFTLHPHKCTLNVIYASTHLILFSNENKNQLFLWAVSKWELLDLPCCMQTEAWNQIIMLTHPAGYFLWEDDKLHRLCVVLVTSVLQGYTAQLLQMSKINHITSTFTVRYTDHKKETKPELDHYSSSTCTTDESTLFGCDRIPLSYQVFSWKLSKIKRGRFFFG